MDHVPSANVDPTLRSSPRVRNLNPSVTGGADVALIDATAQ
jgi:hypothetical protein